MLSNMGSKCALIGERQEFRFCMIVSFLLLSVCLHVHLDVCLLVCLFVALIYLFNVYHPD